MSVMMRPDSGTKSRAASQRDVNKHINELQQELTRSRAETQRAREKLNCLISLVRRSWNGDRNASIHLANIIGLDIPPVLLDSGATGRPGTRMQASALDGNTRAVMNWERLAVKLLQRDYDLMQAEIREYQQRYIENRSRFMDEVMHFHHQDMSRTPLSRPSSGKLSSVDQQFLQMHSLVRSDGINEARPHNRVRPGVMRARSKVQRDVVQQADVKLRDLFVDSCNPVALTPGVPAADASLGDIKEVEHVGPKHVRQDYDDSRRYSQGNLFKHDETVCRKPRPISAAMLREKDRLRARPKSAVVLTMNGEDSKSGDRPLKYETTRPASGKKPSSAKARKGSMSSADSPQTGSNTKANASDGGVPDSPNVLPPQGFVITDDLDTLNESIESQPPISVRVKNAITRPESVDKFSKDLRHMEEMEMMFKMNTVALQKKLGLPENGMI